MVTIAHNVFRNLGTAMQVGNGISKSASISIPAGANVHFENNTFDNVVTPFDMAGTSSGTVTGTQVINDPKLRFDDKAVRRSVGWRRPKGPPLPVICPNCKVVYASKNFIFNGPLFLIKNNEEECQKYGIYGARLSEGLFNLADEVAKALSTPDITYAMLLTITKTSKEVVEGTISLEDGIGIISGMTESLAAIYEAAKKISLLGAAFLTFMAGPIGVYYAREAYLLQLEDSRRTRSEKEVDKSLSRQKAVEKALEAFAGMIIALEAGENPEPPQKPDLADATPPSQEEGPPEASAR